MNRRQFTTFLLSAAAATLTGCETHPRYGAVGIHNRDYDVHIIFSDQDRILIRDYYARPPHGLPPGLARQGKIPPGHAWRMRRREPIPPEVVWHPLPDDLDRRLARLPDGYVRVIVGADIGILNVRTRVVVDLLEDIAH